ncbi:hypothetical protein LKO27_10615 [Tessaracoccus sp. OS52]|uniref:type II toxin-antitoxin system VapC family toxin n=1 Tax=Tessaracoccus sp. OS52 TaxID=2886691 RepID=UPI001D0FCE49|nr:hypothetical protein [Tessaracoccus sp. OS52]MCC2593856.1 hypothetical protein [Tessaracoccus sp. OS52]
MTRFAIDADVALRLIRDERRVAEGDQLVAPSILRSHVMSRIYREVRAAELPERDALRQLDDLAALRIRLLGDRVSRATAWKLASQLGWEDIEAAEYLAVAKLQADVLVTEDPTLVAGARGIVPVAGYPAIFGS